MVLQSKKLQEENRRQIAKNQARIRELWEKYQVDQTVQQATEEGFDEDMQLDAAALVRTTTSASAQERLEMVKVMRASSFEEPRKDTSAGVQRDNSVADSLETQRLLDD